jgi:hypothetical protein
VANRPGNAASLIAAERGKTTRNRPLAPQIRIECPQHLAHRGMRGHPADVARVRPRSAGRECLQAPALHGPPLRHRRVTRASARGSYARRVSRIFTTSLGSVYPHYVSKVEKKGRTRADLHQVIEWLTGFDEAALERHLAAGTTFEQFFASAELNPRASSITGTICGVRVEEIDDPLMQKIRYLDKLVDELARGKPIEKVLRT